MQRWGGGTKHIEIVSNASLLTKEFGRKIVEAGLDRIRISIEAVDEQGYFDIAGVKLNWDEFLENLEFFYKNKGNCEVYIKTVDAAVNTEEKISKFYSTFENICDKISIEHVIPIWAGYDKINHDFDINSSEGLHGDRIREVKICPFPFYSFVVNPDGEVTVCCNDWKRGITIGNVIEESLYSIWNGNKYHNFLKGMLEKGRKDNHSTCATCVYPCYDAVDDIDEYAESLLEKYTRL